MPESFDRPGDAADRLHARAGLGGLPEHSVAVDADRSDAMENRTGSSLLFPLLSILPSPGSCAMLNDAALRVPLRALGGHENAIVSVPAKGGAVAGGIAGVPLALVALPATLPTAIALSDDGKIRLLPFTPVFAFAELGAIVIGGPAWVLGGWW